MSTDAVGFGEVTYINSFLNPDDAIMYLDRCLSHHPWSEWEVVEYQIVMIDGVYRAGTTVKRRQGALFL